MIIFECLPFFLSAGVGGYLVLAAFFPSLRHTDWNKWKIYASYNDSKPRFWSRSLGLLKARKPAAEGELTETSANIIYVGLGLALLFIALLGIRHLAGVPEIFPDIFEKLT